MEAKLFVTGLSLAALLVLGLALVWWCTGHWLKTRTRPQRLVQIALLGLIGFGLIYWASPWLLRGGDPCAGIPIDRPDDTSMTFSGRLASGPSAAPTDCVEVQIRQAADNQMIFRPVYAIFIQPPYSQPPTRYDTVIFEVIVQYQDAPAVAAEFVSYKLNDPGKPMFNIVDWFNPNIRSSF